MKIYQTPQPPVICFFGGCPWPLTFLTGGLSQPLGFVDDRKLFSQWEIHQPGIHLGNQQILLFYYNCSYYIVCYYYIYIIAMINITTITTITTTTATPTTPTTTTPTTPTATAAATATATAIITACLPASASLPTYLPTYLLLAFKPLIKNNKNGVPRAANPGIVHTTGRGSAAGCAGAAGNLSLMWHAINNYHGLGDGFIKDVYTTHKNYDFGVLSCFMMFYYWFQMVVTWGWFIIVLLCVLLASMICGSQGYWRFHNGPQSLIFQY